MFFYPSKLVPDLFKYYVIFYGKSAYIETSFNWTLAKGA